MIFNEDSRVKIPSILHLMKLGYTYLSLKNQKWDESTSIFPEILKNQLQKINSGISEKDAERVFTDVSLKLENEDLGRAFYNQLIDQSGIKLIDLKVLKAPYKIQSSANSFFKSNLNKIVSNREQNQKLSELRDWLLLMLMNGQVRVAHSHAGANLAEVAEGS